MINITLFNNDSSLKLLETDFNIKVKSIEDFRIKIKAKTKEFEDEREEYLKSAEIVQLYLSLWIWNILTALGMILKEPR